MRFERWVLLAAVAMCAISTAVVSVVVLTESDRRCEAINRGNEGNRQAWKFVQTTIAKQQTRTLTPSQQTRSDEFFAGIQERLAPIDC